MLSWTTLVLLKWYMFFFYNMQLIQVLRLFLYQNKSRKVNGCILYFKNVLPKIPFSVVFYLVRFYWSTTIIKEILIIHKTRNRKTLWMLRLPTEVYDIMMLGFVRDGASALVVQITTSCKWGSTYTSSAQY